MRKKKTAPHTRRHQKTSSPKKLGLIVRENKNQQSARTKSVLDNRFHRTALPRYLLLLETIDNEDLIHAPHRLALAHHLLFDRRVF
jgi:hypothetical protein